MYIFFKLIVYDQPQSDPALQNRRVELVLLGSDRETEKEDSNYEIGRLGKDGRRRWRISINGPHKTVSETVFESI